jgi:choloylglycine hydrolase
MQSNSINGLKNSSNTLRHIISRLVLVAMLTMPLPALACTDFVLTASDGSVVTGRSMEWGSDLHSRIVTHPRGESLATTAPGGKKTGEIKSRYGYLGVDANGMDVSLDGLNEKGLSYSLLWLPGYTQYQTVGPDQAAQALPITDLGAWVLGNFATVAEVKAAIAQKRIWAPDVPSFGGVPTAHVALHDATGQNLVLEFVGGEQKIYDNPNGVMTNAPTFDWQIINLSNYLNLKADNAPATKIGPLQLKPPGQGSGFLGMPGDWTPPSRFVRTTALVRYADQPTDAAHAINLSEHILNAVDIPLGTIREVIDGKVYSDYTQWALIKDLNNKRLYYRSYEDLSLKSVGLDETNIVTGAKRTTLNISIPKNQ